MLPHEFEFLRAEDNRSRVHWVVVILSALAVMFVPVLVAVISGGLDQLAGRVTAATAQVESVQPDGTCRSGTRYQIEVSWTADGAAESGTYTKCERPPQVGQSIEIWVSADGDIQTESPRTSRLGLVALSVGLGIAAVGTGVAIVVPRARLRRRLLATAGMPLTPAGQVQIRVGRSSMQVKSLSTPQWTSRADIILHTEPGSSPKRHPRQRMAGTWWLQLAPAEPTAKRRIGLLVRGSERCWIQLTHHNRPPQP